MSQFAIHNVFYRPDAETVTIACEALDGPFKGRLYDLHTTQETLVARIGPTLKLTLGDRWSDEEVRAEASEQLTAMGAELVSVLSAPAS